jgi:hypothetical protein
LTNFGRKNKPFLFFNPLALRSWFSDRKRSPASSSSPPHSSSSSPTTISSVRKRPNTTFVVVISTILIFSFLILIPLLFFILVSSISTSSSTNTTNFEKLSRVDFNILDKQVRNKAERDGIIPSSGGGQSTTTTTMGSSLKFVQKTIKISAQKRGCFLITSQILREIQTDLQQFRVGLCNIFRKYPKVKLRRDEKREEGRGGGVKRNEEVKWREE